MHFVRRLCVRNRFSLGSVTLLTLVLLITTATILVAATNLISRQAHQTTTQVQEFHSFNLADAGVQYAQWLLDTTGGNQTPAQLKANPPATATNHQVLDTNNQPIGSFSLNFQNACPDRLDFQATGQDANHPLLCQVINATLQQSGSKYVLSNWKQLPQYACNTTPPPLTGFAPCNVATTSIDNDAVCQAVTAPQTVNYEQPFTTDFTFRNPGPSTWKSGTYKFATAGGFPDVPLTTDVPPGQSFTFSQPETAPFAAGPFSFNGQVNDGTTPFGGSCTRQIMIPETDNASCGDPPATQNVDPDQKFTVKFTFKNEGNTVWKAGTYQLGSDYSFTPAAPAVVPLPNDVNPKQTVDIYYPITAPFLSQPYTFNTHLLHGNGQFGAGCPASFVVKPVPNASCTATGPTSVNYKDPFTVVYHYQNTGNNTWPAGTYQMSNSTGQPAWIPLPSSVPPKGLIDISYPATGPRDQGGHNMVAQMYTDQTPSGQIFGPSCQFSFTVPPKDDAVCNSVTPPQSVQPGNWYRSDYQFTNTGNTTWAPGYILYRGGLPGLPIIGNVGPDVFYPFVSLADQAPLVPGPHNYTIRMTSPSGVGFGGTCTQTITVLASDATCYSVTDTSVPYLNTAYRLINGHTVFTNTGAATWIPGAYKVLEDWGTNSYPISGVRESSFQISSNVYPGQNIVINWGIISNYTDYIFELQGNGALFGQKCRIY